MKRFILGVALILGAFTTTQVWSGTRYPTEPTGCNSPIIIDLAGDGVQLGRAGVGVDFDIDGDGVSSRTQWVRPGGDEAFLALDRNSNQIVDDGTELFGTGTPLLLEGPAAPDGFVGLAQYDEPALGGNADGVISSIDAVWGELRLWLDANADGRCVPAEMQTLASASIISLPVKPRTSDYIDPAGNHFPFYEYASRTIKPKRVLMVDVFFVELSD